MYFNYIKESIIIQTSLTSSQTKCKERWVNRLKKSLLERMKQTQDKHGIGYINVFNNGKVRVDEEWESKMMKYANELDAFHRIEDVMFDINELYSRDYKYDTLDMHLELGLIYDGIYVNEDQTLKENAKPIDNIVRYYTTNVDCLQDGEKVNDKDIGSWKSRQGFITYNRLLWSIKRNDLEFNGPESFEEFKEQILSGEPFDVSITASLKPKNKGKRLIKR